MGFDILSGLIVLISGIQGGRTGFLSAIISNVFLIVAIILGIVFGNSVGTSVLDVFDFTSTTIATIVGFFIIFSLIIIGGGILSKFTHRQAEKIGLHAQDRLIGFLFGIIRGSALVVALLILARPLLTEWNMLDESYTLQYIDPFVSELQPYLNKIGDDTTQF